MNFKTNAAQCAMKFRADVPWSLRSSATASLAPIVVLISMASSAVAADITWVGVNTGTGNASRGAHWGNPTSWAGAVVPGLDDNAIFGNLAVNANSAPYQPTVASDNGNTLITSVSGLHFNNATTDIVLTVRTGSSLTVSSTTLVSQTASVVLQGTGTFTTTDLSISNGTLTIPTVTVPGRLSGAGTIAGNVTVTGTHSPGGSSLLDGAYTSGIGTQTISVGNTLTYETGSIFQWDIDSGPADQLVKLNQGDYDQVAGAIAGLGGAVFQIVLNGGGSFTDAFWNTDRSWNNIFEGTPDLLAIFSGGFDFAGPGSASGRGSFSFSGSTLNWNAVPEPSSALAGILLGLGLLRRRRR